MKLRHFTVIASAMILMSGPAAAAGAGIVKQNNGIFTHTICSGKGTQYMYVVPLQQSRTATLARCDGMYPDVRDAIGTACASSSMIQDGGKNWPQTWPNRVSEFGISFSCRR